MLAFCLKSASRGRARGPRRCGSSAAQLTCTGYAGPSIVVLVRRFLYVAGFAVLLGCTVASTVDPGPNFVVETQTFDADFYFCRVEPELIVGKKCGAGDPAAGDRANGCHYNPSAVSGMPLQSHPAVNCGGGDHPVDRVQVNTAAAQASLQSVSFQMSRDHLTSPLYVRPTGANHPRVIFDKNDPVVEVIRAWAQR